MKSVVSIGLLLVVAGAAMVLAEPPAAEKAASEAEVAKAKAKPAAAKDAKTVRVYVFDKSGKLVGPVNSAKVVYSPADWRQRLTADQFKILRSKETEQPFCGTLLDNKKEGVYSCAGCGLPLFSSDSKFHSGTGWPSFFQPIAPGNVAQQIDHSHGTIRIEIKCERCGGHLGHVFNDGPKPTGLRFCLNSESLNFTDNDKLATLADPDADKLVAAKDAPKAAPSKTANKK